jgi:hypothetical protein
MQISFHLRHIGQAPTNVLNGMAGLPEHPAAEKIAVNSKSHILNLL